MRNWSFIGISTPQKIDMIDLSTRQNIEAWLGSEFDEETRREIQHLLDTAPEQLADAFYKRLEFGTGGMRGLMGIGCNRLNVYTIHMATQGLSSYILKHPLPENCFRHKVMIGYDSRHQSAEFAEAAARVFAGNGIEAHLFTELHPTPLVSFGCRLRGCTAAIMITASHNPRQYNGYKVYWSDGGQVLSPHDSAIITEVNKVISPKQVKISIKPADPLIIKESKEIDQAYLAAITTLQLFPEDNQRFGDQLKIYYTPLHGAGIMLVPQALHLWGFTKVQIIEEQGEPNGEFPTVAYPNPEDPAVMDLGILALKKGSGDLLLATDPDADRLSVAVLHQNEVHLLNGNQIACLCLHHILQALSDQKRLPKRGACIKSLPTTELFSSIANDFGLACFNVLTGFKYVAEKIREWEKNPSDGYQFIFGGEDSNGYLFGTHSRDKDAIVCCALIGEIALQAKLQKKTLVDLLHQLTEKYGFYREGLLSIDFPDTREGKEQQQQAMKSLRSNPPSQFNGHRALILEDYQASKKTFLTDGKITLLKLPASDMLIFRLENEGKIIVRPSGTEPKIKIYGALKNGSQEELDALLAVVRITLLLKGQRTKRT